MTALQSLSNTTNALYVVPFFDTKSEISAVFPFWQRACNSSFVSTYLLFSFHTTKSQVEHHSLTSLTCRVFSPLHFGQGVLNVSDGPWSGKSRTTLNSGESLSAQSNFQSIYCLGLAVCHEFDHVPLVNLLAEKLSRVMITSQQLLLSSLFCFNRFLLYSFSSNSSQQMSSGNDIR